MAQNKAQKPNKNPFVRASHRGRMLALLDLAPILLSDILFIVCNPSADYAMPARYVFLHILLNMACVYGMRALLGVYLQVWRFGGIHAYARLIVADGIAGGVYMLAQRLLFPDGGMLFLRIYCIAITCLICTVLMRFLYQSLYRAGGRRGRLSALVWRILGNDDPTDDPARQDGMRVAIVGAGSVGVALSTDLINSSHAMYVPGCFIEIDAAKIGRQINGVPVIDEENATPDALRNMAVRAIVFALPDSADERRARIFERYKSAGFKMLVYDSVSSETGGRRRVRDFRPEELLFRSAQQLSDARTPAFFKGKTVLISGGGGSIGSELCRQLARMQVKKLVVLDIYENNAYDLRQELRRAYAGRVDCVLEIASVCDRDQLRQIFARHRPDVVLHAAAHKHVPLMEHNCCEAVRNNVFGTRNIVEVSEEFGVKKFIMVSTDKAVNPTNVMGATKRLCEMLVLSRVKSDTVFSATRFGNVLGSNGSVIPLFRRQIEAGGPVTVTDKRIVRYFMTIPEASGLVLESAAMAKRGELFVLDMGKPVKILELAENMIRLSGLEPYRDIDIVETGLRPGEKLYEELLIRGEEQEKTENSMIFIERDKPVGAAEMQKKLDLLQCALELGDDENMRAVIRRVVPTYRAPEEVNAQAGEANEMRMTNDGK